MELDGVLCSQHKSCDQVTQDNPQILMSIVLGTSVVFKNNITDDVYSRHLFQNDAFIIPPEISSPSSSSPVAICAVSGSENEDKEINSVIFIE